MTRKKTRGGPESSGMAAKVGMESNSAILKSMAVVGILLCAMVAFGAYVSRRPAPETGSVGRSLNQAPLPTPEYSSNSPAKEYVYAGSKLVAVTEPVQPAPDDLAVWRLSTGRWYVKGSTGTLTEQTWGVSTDKPTPGDYDGDGKTDFCVYRPDDDGTPGGDEGRWYVIYSGNSTLDSNFWGGESDTPVQADFDGDARTDYAVYRPSNQTWYIKFAASGNITSWQYGNSTDTPVPSDFDGDGKADMALWRDSNATWYIWQSSLNSGTSYQWGSSGDLPVPGDYDGDLKTDYAVWTTSDTWSIKKSSDGNTMTAVSWGYQGSDIAVQGDYDGDGKTDRAVWRSSNGTWYILQSGNGYTRTEVWGQSGDVPVPAPYRR